MAKKTLEEKIKQVGFWTFGGVFWYLVIAFFLKSSYPIYEYNLDRFATYDTIKDALTLAAAFLAPVAAFVLFSDWRIQHKEINNEKNSYEIRQSLWGAYMPIKDYTHTNTSDKVGASVKVFYENLFYAKQLIENIYVFDKESSQFKKDVISLFELLEETHQKWSACVYGALALDAYERGNPDQSMKLEALRREYSEANSKTLTEINKLKDLKI